MLIFVSLYFNEIHHLTASHNGTSMVTAIAASSAQAITYAL